MKTQKSSPFFFALQSALVPKGKVLAHYYYYNQKLFIQLQNENSVFEEAYLVAYDKRNSRFIAIQELTRESSDIYSIIFHEDDFLSRLESVKYVRLCLATYKKGEFVYTYLNSPDVNKKNYSVCDAYIATIISDYLDKGAYRLVLYYSEAGALSIKPIKDDNEFEKYLRPQLISSYADSQKIYFKIIYVSSYMYNFSFVSADEKESLDLCIENQEPYVRNLEQVTVSCKLDDINIYGGNRYELLFKKEKDMVAVNGLDKIIKFLYHDQYYFIKIENSKTGTANISFLTYKFSVVISAESDESLLAATIQSLQEQDLDFEENFQIILYGAEKTDIDEYIQQLVQSYPNNVYIIAEDFNCTLEKEVSACVGKYITFAVAGDVFSPKTFSCSYKFLEENQTNIDAAEINIVSLNQQAQKHTDDFNKKVDFFSPNSDYQNTLISLRGLFIKNSVLKKLMAEKLICQEDLTCQVSSLYNKKSLVKISDNSTLFLADCSMEDFVSAEKFFSAINNMNSVIEKTVKKKGFVPYFCQKIFIARLSLMLDSLEPIMDEYNHPEYDFEQEWQSVSILLCNVEDNLIMELATSRFRKLFLLDLKYKGEAHFEKTRDNLYVVYGNTRTFNVEKFITRIDLMTIDGGNLIIEGNCHIPVSLLGRDCYIYAVVNGEKYDVIQVNRNSDRYLLDKMYLFESGFKINLPLTNISYEIQIFNHVNGYACERRKIEFMPMSPLGTELKASYYYKDGYMVTTNGRALFCSKCSEEERKEQERKLQKEIRERDKTSAEEVISLRNYYWDNVDKKTSKIWLVTDRPDRADDNGEAFFRYMAAHKQENIDCSFILSQESGKYEELTEIGNIIEPYTNEHKKIHLLADYIISSQMSESAYNPFGEQNIYFRDLYRRNKFIFLQHGVIHNHHGRVLGKYKRNFYGLVASAAREAEYFISSRFHYTSKEVWLTGLPRFDRLYHEEKKIITIMPTWRKYLTIRAYDPSIGTLNWVVKDNFVESEYFKFFDHLINDERLLSKAEEYGYKICFMPHITFLHQADLFHKDSRVEIYEYEKSYREIYAESNLIVTDYSSAVFDFAYLQKPILYCQFDQKDFWTKHTVKKGYWDFEEDGFGEVSYDLDTLVDLIIEYIKSGCVLKDMYRKRIQEFFVYIDQNCCERIVNRIFELEEMNYGENYFDGLMIEKTANTWCKARSKNEKI